MVFYANLKPMSKEIKVESSENKGLYELAFHLVPTVGDDNVDKVFDEITKMVEKFNGKIVSKSEPALLNLEYTMEKIVDAVKSKYNTAYFAWIIFEGGNVQELHSEIESNKNVLRHLLVKTDQNDGIKAETVASILSGDQKEKVPVEEEKEIEPSVVDIKEVEEVNVEEEKTDKDKVDEAIDELVK